MTARPRLEVARTRNEGVRNEHVGVASGGLGSCCGLNDGVARQRSRADHERSSSEAQRRAIIVRHSPLERAEDQG